MALHQDPRDNFSVTGTSTGAGSTSLSASQTAAANVQYAVTHISGSTDLAGNLIVFDGTITGTKLWQIKLPANTPFSADFTEPLLASPGNAVTARIDTGSLAVSVNAAGYRISSV